MRITTTTNLCDFGVSDLKRAGELLKALAEAIDGEESGYILGGRFSLDGVTLMKNQQSGWIFLTNAEYEVAILEGGRLEFWYNLPYSGEEGTAEDLLEIFDFEGLEMDPDDVDYLHDYGIINDEEYNEWILAQELDEGK